MNIEMNTLYSYPPHHWHLYPYLKDDDRCWVVFQGDSLIERRMELV